MANEFSSRTLSVKRAAWLRYSVALALVGIALALRMASDKFLGEAHPFPFFLAAVAVAAWYGGLGPALLALILGYLAADWFFIAPRHALGDFSSLGLVSLATYLITGLVMSVAVTAAQGSTRNERQRSAQLEHERERFRVSLSSIGDAVIATDAHGHITFMNPVAENVTGWTQQEVSGQPLQTYFKIYNELTRKPVADPVAKVLRDGGVVGLANHTVLVSKSGKEIPIDDSAAPIRDSKGQVLGAILVFRDVTEQRKAQLATRRLAAIVQNSDDAIIGKDLQGIVSSWNVGAERIFGYAAAEIVGSSITKIVPPDRQKEEQDILARLQRGERVDHFETIRQTKDARQIQVSLTISPIRDAEGQIVGASTIARDISERKRAEQHVQESTARTNAILESALDAIICMDHESRIIEFNPAAEKMFGFTRSQMIGRLMTESIIPERFRAQHHKGVQRYLATGEGPVLHRRIELTALRANGEEFPVELAIVPIPSFQPPIFTGFIRDLTEKKRAEAALETAREDLIKVNRSLETAVERRTADLQQSLKSMETVLYTIAHDLRGPTRAMQGFAQLLEKEYGSQLDETARMYVNRISVAAQKNDTLICDLLEYGRLAHAQIPMTDIDLGESVQKVLQDLQPQIRAQNATIELGETWHSVRANDSVLSQIITNLTTNALKFVKPGVPPHIRIWAESGASDSQSSIKLSVKDNGIGIPEQVQRRLFQPFQRGTADTQYQGTGMGLAIVQKGAERLGGKIGFNSKPGEGSCFWVELPAGHSLESKEVHEQKSPASRR